MNANDALSPPPTTEDEPDAAGREDAVGEPSEPSEPTDPVSAHAAAAAAELTGLPAAAGSEQPAAAAATTATAAASPVPEPRATADPDADADRGKPKKKPKAVRGRGASTGGTKSLVVWHQGKVHYTDDSVLVLDLDEAASADLDVHDLVDRLTELRELLDSPGRSEAVAALVEIIQEKALT